MARARNIKPGFCRNEDLAECSVTARLCFALLPMLADREGRLEDRPKRIKGELFPFDSIEVDPLLQELEARGLILRYAANGAPLIQILAFLKHQNPHHREPESTLPPPQSLRLGADGKWAKPEADAACDAPEASGQPQASPGLDPTRDDLARGSSRADSGILIPDTGGIPEANASSSAGADQAAGGEGTGKAEKQKLPPCPFDEIVGAYHDRLPALPKVRLLDGKTGETRKRAMRSLWSWVLSSKRSDGQRRAETPEQALDWIRGYFNRASENDFLMGRTPRSAQHANWRPDFDFLLTDKGMKQVIEKTAA